MRILIVVGQDKIISGGAIQAIELTRELRERGHAAGLVFPPPSGSYSPEPFRRIEQEGLLLGTVPMRGTLLRGALRLRRLLRRERIEAVYAVKGNALALALLATTGLRLPVVAHRGVDYPISRFSRLKYHHPRVRAIVAVSESTRRTMAASSPRLGRKTVVVYQAVAGRFFHPEDPGRLRREYAIPEHVPVIGVVGNLLPRKGHRHLVACLPAILAEFPDARFVFIGAGRLSDVVGPGVPGGDRILHTGFRRDPHELLPGLTVSVNPAVEGEGLTGTTRESMAAGVPVVVTDVAGTKELIEDGVSGFIVPAGDPAALAAPILRLLRDPQLRRRMGAKGCERVEAIASAEARARAMERIFREAIGGVSSEAATPDRSGA